ncbi:MAG: hypothetical protein DBX41_04510 [Clostridiales bacterium]|nr:MAG: hypothetical protein DBX41_04510 [Clostridiales bacterium]
MAVDLENPNTFGSYELYNEKIETFFLENHVSKKTFHKGDHIDEVRKNVVAYIQQGYNKIYSVNENGNERFTGFMPQYSILLRSPGISLLNKYSVAATTVVIYYASLHEYLEFLAKSPELILYQIYEPYYRRNFNDLPLLESQNQIAKTKVYIYLHYLAMRFGKTSAENAQTVIINNAPTLKDIAHYNDIHPNNVVTFFNELKKKGVVSKIKDRLVIHRMDLLEQEIAALKK